MSTWSAGRPYIEGIIEALGHAGDQPVLRWDGAGTTGSELLAAIYRYARTLESLDVARERLGPVIAHTYGASEMGIVSALTPAEHDRPGRFACAGRIVPGVQVRFRSPDGTWANVSGRSRSARRTWHPDTSADRSSRP